jgi:hypothetical protein
MWIRRGVRTGQLAVRTSEMSRSDAPAEPVADSDSPQLYIAIGVVAHRDARGCGLKAASVGRIPPPGMQWTDPAYTERVRR